MVKSYLRDLEQDYTSYFEYDSFEDSQTVKEQKEKIKALEELKRASEYKLQEVQGDLFKVNFIRDNLEKSIQDYFTYNYFSHSFFGFDNNYKVEYKSLTSEIGKIKIDFKENNEILNKIEKLDICKIERFQNFISYFQTIKSLYILTIWQLRFIQRLLNLNFL